jgi:hypothetical protein
VSASAQSLEQPWSRGTPKPEQFAYRSSRDAGVEYLGEHKQPLAAALAPLLVSTVDSKSAGLKNATPDEALTGRAAGLPEKSSRFLDTLCADRYVSAHL